MGMKNIGGTCYDRIISVPNIFDFVNNKSLWNELWRSLYASFMIDGSGSALHIRWMFEES